MNAFNTCESVDVCKKGRLLLPLVGCMVRASASVRQVLTDL